MEVPESPRFFKNHQGTSTIHADVSTVRLRIMPMHPDLINPGNLSSTVAKIVNV